MSLLFLTGCVSTRPLPSTPNGNYAGVLPTRDGLIGYRAAFHYTGVSAVMADVRTKSWFNSAGRVLSMEEQNPISKKTDLVYIANLPARRLPDSTGRMANVPALRFWVTIDNIGDSTHVFVTNFEVTDRKGSFQALEKQPYTARQTWVTMWLTDVDAAVEEMMASLTTYLNKP